MNQCCIAGWEAGKWTFAAALWTATSLCGLVGVHMSVRDRQGRIWGKMEEVGLGVLISGNDVVNDLKIFCHSATQVRWGNGNSSSSIF